MPSPRYFPESHSIYRLARKCVRQPGLMKLSRTNIDGKYLSSDRVSIALAYCRNSPHLSLKSDIQFLLIQTLQNLLKVLKKLVLVSQLNPFEFFFDCSKQVEVTGVRSGE
jgi:hypothetical protein